MDAFIYYYHHQCIVPVKPWTPVAPVGPTTPFIPVAPVGPRAPAAPALPAGPDAPASIQYVSRVHTWMNEWIKMRRLKERSKTDWEPA